MILGDMGMLEDYRKDSLKFISDIILSNEIDYEDLLNLPKNSSELALLYLLKINDGTLTSGEISKKLKIQTSRVAALLNALEKKKLINRKRKKDDKRVIEVSITDDGLNILSDSIEDLIAKISEAYEILGKEDMEKFKGYIIRLCNNRKEKQQCLD